MARVTRDNQKTDTIYVLPDGASSFWTPDGEGRYWYDSVEEAVEDSGIERIVHLDQSPED